MWAELLWLQNSRPKLNWTDGSSYFNLWERLSCWMQCKCNVCSFTGWITKLLLLPKSSHLMNDHLLISTKPLTCKGPIECSKVHSKIWMKMKETVWRSGRCWPSLRQGKALDGELVHIETAGGRENQDNEQSFKGVDSTFRLGSGALLQLLGKPPPSPPPTQSPHSHWSLVTFPIWGNTLSSGSIVFFVLARTHHFPEMSTNRRLHWNDCPLYKNMEKFQNLIDIFGWINFSCEIKLLS